MIDHHRLEDVAIRLATLDRVEHRAVLRVQVEQDADVTELEVRVDERDPLLRVAADRQRQVRRQGRASDSSLGGEDGDDLVVLGVGFAHADRRSRGIPGGLHLLAPNELALVDALDRGRELVGAERLDEELARAGQHGALQVLGLTMDAHHDHGAVRQPLGDDLRSGDAVHARHVDVHDDDVRAHLHRQLDRFLSAAGRASHVDLALRAEEARQVVARLGDVVDDEELDHARSPVAAVWHEADYGAGVSSLSCSTMLGMRRPYSATSWSIVMPRVSPTSSSSAWRTTAVSAPCSPSAFCANLIDLGVLVGAGEDDDHAVDDGLGRRVVLVDHAVAVRVRRRLRLHGARVAHVQDALVLEDCLDRPLVLEAGDRLEARRRILVRVGGRVGRLLEDADLLRQDDVDRVAGGDEEVEAGHPVDLEGDRLLARVEHGRDVDAAACRVRSPRRSPGNRPEPR